MIIPIYYPTRSTSVTVNNTVKIDTERLAEGINRVGDGVNRLANAAERERVAVPAASIKDRVALAATYAYDVVEAYNERAADISRRISRVRQWQGERRARDERALAERLQLSRAAAKNARIEAAGKRYNEALDRADEEYAENQKRFRWFRKDYNHFLELHNVFELARLWQESREVRVPSIMECAMSGTVRDSLGVTGNYVCSTRTWGHARRGRDFGTQFYTAKANPVPHCMPFMSMMVDLHNACQAAPEGVMQVDQNLMVAIHQAAIAAEDAGYKIVVEGA